jgi:hypothetical protein
MDKARECRWLRELTQADGTAWPQGHRRLPGGYILRLNGPDETEFVVVNLFESLESVIRFAGPDYSVAVFEPEAKAFLSRIENFAAHYEVRACPTLAPLRPLY